MVVGTLDYRAPHANAQPRDYLSFNAAMHIVPTPQVQVVEVYDKMHPVPFGEYVPFERTFPVLSNLFGMGRGLTAGRRYSTFSVRPDVRLGPLICFEDVFPEQARGMVLRGANVLLTITNDAWYWETSGSRQHLLNSVLRAVETCRPLVRSGNNSDTCLVLPDGRIVDPLRDPATGSPFARRAGVFTVPVYDRLPTTFYTLYGNLFAVLCAIAAALAAGWCLLRVLRRRQRLARAIQPDA
jgi:apolipoprotein N-acyltransferase